MFNFILFHRDIYISLHHLLKKTYSFFIEWSWQPRQKLTYRSCKSLFLGSVLVSVPSCFHYHSFTVRLETRKFESSVLFSFSKIFFSFCLFGVPWVFIWILGLFFCFGNIIGVTHSCFLDLNSNKIMSINLLKLLFTVLFIHVCRSRFLSGIIFLLSERLPLTFTIVHMLAINSFRFCIREGLYFNFSFQGYFYWV